MGDFGPSLNHVHVFVGFIEHFHCDGQQFVGHRENVKLRAVIAARFVVGDLELKVQVAVGMLHLNSRQMDGVHGAECGQCREVKVGTSVTQLLQCGALVAVVAHAQVAALIGVQHQLGVGRLHSNVTLPSTHRARTQEHHRCKDKRESFHRFDI